MLFSMLGWPRFQFCDESSLRMRAALRLIFDDEGRCFISTEKLSDLTQDYVPSLAEVHSSHDDEDVNG
jgi:hypothetical protein